MARAPRTTQSGERVTVRNAYDRQFAKSRRSCTQPTQVWKGLRPIPADFRKDDTQ
ncbi:hypothetical protein [Microbispora sp. ATCC PTA-5024]|uniref:hypothetical protein n=1 Tax=Microbispora sp. ATCC PTA-5024 TaxID=316330 RepID=UPI0012ECF691|nr:hypothetical protein [Microbispora sp. ATCC PTA-5024]